MTCIRTIAIVLLGTFVALSTQGAGPPPKSASCATCLGGICVRPNQMPEADFVSRYGDGVLLERSWSNVVESSSRCYYDAKQQLWIQAVSLRADTSVPSYMLGVEVSMKPLCDKKIAPKQPFPKLALANGLGIGDRA